ncbi:hypothetical protein [Streptomyces sp. NPDC058084]|uniref:hypothetical protein n=1 Tax=Streptomyces sp. NPDC058084 TaxID=3346333 RepID=UPI0036E4DC44
MNGLTWAPGSDALAKISSLLLRSQQVTAGTLAELSALDGSSYTAVPGSRPAMDALAGAVAAASSASTDLAQAISANPLEGAAFPGPPADEDAVREARHAEAIPVITEHLADAAYGFDLAATCCAYVATGITHDLDRVPKNEKLPKLNTRQFTALQALAENGGTSFSTGRIGAVRVQAANGANIGPATWEFFEKHRLVHIDIRHSLYHGQMVTLTDRARRLLTQPRPTTKASPAVVPRPQPLPRVTRR